VAAAASSDKVALARYTGGRGARQPSDYLERLSQQLSASPP
jgi:hypothetical protein